jgi:hypothetical protein
VKIVPSDFKLTAISAAFWYQGDGCLALTRNRRINFLMLCTDGFNRKSVQHLRSQLKLAGFSTRVKKAGRRKDGGMRWQVLMAPRTAQAFIAWIRPWVHSDFAYKLSYKGVPLMSCGWELALCKEKAIQAFVKAPIDLIRHSPLDKGRYGRHKFVYDLEVEGEHNYVAEGFVVSNSMLYKLFHDHIEAVSYRVGKSGAPIVHSQRLFGPGGLKAKIPPELAGTVLRGEAYGTRQGKSIPAQELGGLLNSGVAKSLEAQKQKGVQLRTMLFDVAGEQDKPYAERLAKLQKVIAFLPKDKFHLPESATEPAAMKNLWEQVSTGKNPLTNEGVVSWPEQGPPTKVKVTPESDVWVKGVFPGEKGLAGVGAGGFEYGTSPEGPVVGRVGTGFSEEARKQMLADPDSWVGRMARIRSMGQFPGGAHRAPAFLALHEDYPNKTAELVSIVKARHRARTR